MEDSNQQNLGNFFVGMNMLCNPYMPIIIPEPPFIIEQEQAEDFAYHSTIKDVPVSTEETKK
jgi:hypothetical protein